MSLNSFVSLLLVASILAPTLSLNATVGAQEVAGPEPVCDQGFLGGSGKHGTRPSLRCYREECRARALIGPSTYVYAGIQNGVDFAPFQATRCLIAPQVDAATYTVDTITVVAGPALIPEEPILLYITDGNGPAFEVVPPLVPTAFTVFNGAVQYLSISNAAQAQYTLSGTLDNIYESQVNEYDEERNFCNGAEIGYDHGGITPPGGETGFFLGDAYKLCPSKGCDLSGQYDYVYRPNGTGKAYAINGHYHRGLLVNL